MHYNGLPINYVYRQTVVLNGVMRVLESDTMVAYLLPMAKIPMVLLIYPWNKTMVLATRNYNRALAKVIQYNGKV